jgi:DNA-binding transcriptional LysR family regulator
MDIPWEDVRLFLAVAEAGSVSGAARSLRLGQPTVTRRLQLLEYALGAALFRRSATGAKLTAAGLRLLEPARRMAEWAGEVGRAAEKTSEGPAGLVRVTAAPFVAADLLAPFSVQVAQRHPGLRLEVLSTMNYLDLVRGEADLALRPRKADKDDLVTVHSQEYENAVFVSRQLAAKPPKNATLRDLPWVAWSPPYEALPPNPQLAELMPGYLPAFTSDHFLVMLAAAQAGAGAIVLPRLHRAGPHSALVPLEVPLGPFSRGTMHLVAARSAMDIPRVRTVAQLLVDALKESAAAPPREPAKEPAVKRGKGRTPRAR